MSDGEETIMDFKKLGRLAYMNGVGREANPYPMCRAANYWWDLGWLDAKEENDAD